MHEGEGEGDDADGNVENVNGGWMDDERAMERGIESSGEMDASSESSENRLQVERTHATSTCSSEMEIEDRVQRRVPGSHFPQQGFEFGVDGWQVGIDSSRTICVHLDGSQMRGEGMHIGDVRRSA